MKAELVQGGRDRCRDERDIEIWTSVKRSKEDGEGASSQYDEQPPAPEA